MDSCCAQTVDVRNGDEGKQTVSTSPDSMGFLMVLKKRKISLDKETLMVKRTGL